MDSIGGITFHKIDNQALQLQRQDSLVSKEESPPRKLIRTTSIVKSDKVFNIKENLGSLIFETPPQEKNKPVFAEDNGSSGERQALQQELQKLADESMDSPSQFIFIQPEDPPK